MLTESSKITTTADPIKVKLGMRDFHHQQNPKLKSSIYVNLSDSMEPLQ